MPNEADKYNVRKLAGPGVKGMEEDVPLFHIDVPSEEVDSLAANPLAFYAERGIGPEQGVAPDGTMDVSFTFSKKQWNGTQWVEESASHRAPSFVWCCYVTSNSSQCHAHAHEE